MTYFSYMFWYKIILTLFTILHFAPIKYEIISTPACMLLKLPAFKKSFVHIAFHKLHVNVNGLQCSYSTPNFNKECFCLIVSHNIW